MELPKEAFLYWIHCNRCFEIYVRKQRKFQLLSCQHISCEKCVSKVEDENDAYICPICKNKVTGRLMGNSLPPQIKELFHPKPWLDGLPTAHILRFQQPHRTHFQKGMERLSREHERLEQTTSQLRANAKKKFEELENLRYERKQLEQRARRVNEQRKEIKERSQREAELRNQAASTSSFEQAQTDDSGYAIHGFMPRHPTVAPPRSTLSVDRPRTVLSVNRPRPPLSVNGPRLQNPNNFSFRNFAFRDTANFTL